MPHASSTGVSLFVVLSYRYRIIVYRCRYRITEIIISVGTILSYLYYRMIIPKLSTRSPTLLLDHRVHTCTRKRKLTEGCKRKGKATERKRPERKERKERKNETKRNMRSGRAQAGTRLRFPGTICPTTCLVYGPT